MNWVPLALQILSVLPKLMVVAEEAFDGVPDSGADKKRMVKTVIQSIVAAVLGVSMGAQRKTWGKIERITDPAIDIMCTFLFPNDEKVTK